MAGVPCRTAGVRIRARMPCVWTQGATQPDRPLKQVLTGRPHAPLLPAPTAGFGAGTASGGQEDPVAAPRPGLARARKGGRRQKTRSLSKTICRPCLHFPELVTWQKRRFCKRYAARVYRVFLLPERNLYQAFSVYLKHFGKAFPKAPPHPPESFPKLIALLPKPCAVCREVFQNSANFPDAIPWALVFLDL